MVEMRAGGLEKGRESVEKINHEPERFLRLMVMDGAREVTPTILKEQTGLEAYLMGCPIRGVILDPIVAMKMGIQGQGRPKRGLLALHASIPRSSRPLVWISLSFSRENEREIGNGRLDLACWLYHSTSSHLSERSSLSRFEAVRAGQQGGCLHSTPPFQEAAALWYGSPSHSHERMRRRLSLSSVLKATRAGQETKGAIYVAIPIPLAPLSSSSLLFSTRPSKRKKICYFFDFST
ncbi:hypothetical protein MA16_Dca023725 [Dendrobium catenatum]|uniref:Uncharacterized protein n=1 Tax=Dendrobium catenatum TaxID=906689 RepID=A0A2I0X0P1_9ASPA|nr:hypothetical protein MA16_Dca023725 [Dendrobium catenatum]